MNHQANHRNVNTTLALQQMLRALSLRHHVDITIRSDARWNARRAIGALRVARCVA